ncbi:U11/U12 small nuclear ribonucleoprotein 48 kDa protein [Tanacetum coccineum]
MDTFPPPPPPPNPNPNPNTLQNTLQTLKHLIHISKHTLNSLPTPFTTLQTPIPNNPKHPSSSSFEPEPVSSSFFYKDCPSVVTFPSFNNSTLLNHTFALPVILSPECDNENNPLSDLASLDYFDKLLPSECFNVRLELSTWNDYPAFYSFSVVRLVLSCYVARNEGLMDEWILVNSPFYGVVISDVFVTDCVMVLFRVCLRAIVREAIGLVSRGENGCRFECRVLREVMMWLGEQFGVLYGDVNGKMFAINMLKQWLMVGLSGSVFFGGEQRVEEPSVGPVKGVVSVSEVEAAVVGLRERAALEARIKAIRASQFVPAYQRVQEHQYITKVAEEERKKRPDYRPIIEHDGVLWHRGDNQDANKNKSREELLAEERDYKRRRMSYRGKKMKRSTTQVMRDIIDEYMEEIKHTNMANQPFVDATNLASGPSSVVNAHSDKHRHDESEYKSCRKESVSDMSNRSTRPEDEQ